MRPSRCAARPRTTTRGGSPGWSFAEVLPTFVALERDLDFGTAPYHGELGPVPIRRYLGSEQSAVAVAAAESLASAGIQAIADHNEPVGGAAWHRCR